MIWKWLIPTGRVMEIHPSTVIKPSARDSTYGPELQLEVDFLPTRIDREGIELSTNYNAPIWFSICQESCNFTIGYFEEIFSHSNREGNRIIYFNPTLDKIFLDLRFKQPPVIPKADSNSKIFLL